ncbi:uncharacterized protein LOC143283558, partial [Babylonia areolata]|uniref:uncharacterized protein LOC143283558 n=1 Tax=Babylonia areolata TaxID=304850 RepID=UPI003FD55CFB
MADTTDGYRYDRSHSPREDFDPLSDDGHHHQHHHAYDDHLSPPSGEDYYDYVEAQIEYEEDDREPESLGSRYGVTPPLPRVSKREKERQASATRGSYMKRSSRENKDYNSRRKSQPRSVLNVIKDAHQGDPTLCKLSGFDSDDNIDPETLREKREKRKKDSRELKKQTKSRELDRSMKRMSDDFTGLDVGSMTQVPLESSGRFSHLMAKPVMAISADSHTRRQWTEPPDCPADRKQFSQTFGLLIKLGTQAKMDKERKLASYSKRQMSSEVEQWKSQQMDYMWIELNAYLHGCSPEDEQKSLTEKRNEVEKVLTDIINFQFHQCKLADVPDECSNSSCVDRDVYKTDAWGKGVRVSEITSDVCVTPSAVGRTSPEEENIGAVGSEGGCCLSVNLDEDVSASFHDVVLTASMVELQQEALVEVQKLLDRLDACERLYPTMRQIANDYPAYGDSNFVRRVKCLNLWLNITCDLCHKLKLFGRIIGAEEHRIEWPVIKFDFPFPRHNDSDHMRRPSVPNIMENRDTSDSEVEDDDDSDDGGEEEEDSVAE